MSLVYKPASLRYSASEPTKTVHHSACALIVKEDLINSNYWFLDNSPKVLWPVSS